MRVFHSDSYEVPLPPGHRFPMEKYRLLREALLERGVLTPESLTESTPCPRQDLARVHTPRYLDALSQGTLTDAEQRRLGFPWSPELMRRFSAAVAGTLDAARAALQDGIGGNLSGGTHHGFPDHGEGFCVFNDIAVAIRVLQASRDIRRAVVVDLDVHQGNGTAAVFTGDDSVFTFSMHGENNFPSASSPPTSTWACQTARETRHTWTRSPCTCPRCSTARAPASSSSRRAWTRSRKTRWDGCPSLTPD